MQLEVNDILMALVSEARNFTKGDVLVHIDPADSRIFQHALAEIISTADVPAKIVREYNSNLREKGVNTLCFALGAIKTNHNGLQVNSPLILLPTRPKEDRVRGEIHLDHDLQCALLNPFVEDQLLHLYQLSFELIEELKKLISEYPLQCLEQLHFMLTECGFEVNQEETYLGNFHHHRFTILHDLDRIASRKRTACVRQVLGEGTEGLYEFKLSSKRLFPADPDHRQVFELIQAKNVCVKGPPGTGKSQLIANLVAKFLYSNNSVLLLSEKRTALEVIQKRLSHFELDFLVHVVSDHKEAGDFVSHLRDNWLRLETIDNERIVYLDQTLHREQNLQLWLDILGQENLIGGVSLKTYCSLREQVHGVTTFSSGSPSIDLLLEHNSTLILLFEKRLVETYTCLSDYSKSLVSALDLDAHLKAILTSLEYLNEHYSVSSLAEIEALAKKAALAQIAENQLFKNNSELFIPDSKKQARFLRVLKKLRKLSLTDASQPNHWLRTPEIAELQFLSDLIEKQSFGAKRKVRRIWKTMSKADIGASKELIKNELNRQMLLVEISKLKSELEDLGVDSTSNDPDLIAILLVQHSVEEWREIQQFVHLKSAITNDQATISSVLNGIKLYLRPSLKADLRATINSVINDIPKLVLVWKDIKTLPGSFWQALQQSSDWNSFQGTILYSNWIRFTEHYPELSAYTPDLVYQKAQSIIALESEESPIFAREIIRGIRSKFQSAQELLATPARKLSVAEQQRKVRLRKGKALLTKEFGKKRRHMSIHELFHSEAREWIELLIPVFLCNASQLAKSIPLEEELFDVVLFDEASQIPLYNALGALYRSKRFMIAGDDQQMGPGGFGISENTQDLLSQAMYNSELCMLKHHYRSSDSRLIQFSNDHFYEGELKCFPVYPIADSPLTMCHLPDGTYVNRINICEAKAIAERIEALLQTSEEIGVVAFSEEQLNCIYNQLSPPVRDEFETRLDAGKGFFKAADKVQGDECDHLLISFTFGYNDEGKFNLQFGPMATASGRNRLNVILTRARNIIEFYTSVRSNDFKVSSNETIELIRKWFSYLENKTDMQDHFVYHIKGACVEGDAVVFRNVQEEYKNAIELVNTIRILESRNWKVILM